MSNQQLVPPSSREALLEWGRSLVSSNRAHNPTPTGRMPMMSGATPTRHSQQHQQQQTPRQINNNSMMITSPSGQQINQPPNRPSSIGGQSVAQQQHQNQQNQQLQQNQQTPSSTGTNNNNLFTSPFSNNLASNNNSFSSQQQQQQRVPNNSLLTTNSSNLSNLRSQHEPSGMGELQPPPSSLYQTQNPSTKPPHRTSSGPNMSNQQVQTTTTGGNQINNNNTSTPRRTTTSSTTPTNNNNNYQNLFASNPQQQQAVGDTPLSRLSMLADNEVPPAATLAGGGGGGTGITSRSSNASTSGPNPTNSGDTGSEYHLNPTRNSNSNSNKQQPLATTSTTRQPSMTPGGSRGGSVASSSLAVAPYNNNNNNNNKLSLPQPPTAELLANNAAARRAVLEDHRTYISHLKTMLETNDDRFRNRERELTQILERLSEAEKGISESISNRTTAAAVSEAAHMRLDGGENYHQNRIFDGTDAAALEKDIEEAKDEIAQWENEEALCGAAVAQLAASIAELEQQSSDSVRIFLDCIRFLLKLGDVASQEARHGVSAHSNSSLIGETTLANKNRLFNAVAGNLDKAHFTSQRIKVGLAAIEKLCAAARAHAAGGGAPASSIADSELAQKASGLGALMKIADKNQDENNSTNTAGAVATVGGETIRVAGVEIFSSLSGPSIAMNDYLIQLNDALTASHQMQELIVTDLVEATEVCNAEIRKTGAVVDDAHEALQELVSQVDFVRDELTDALSQEEQIKSERADVARQLRALDVSATDQKKKLTSEQDAVANNRRKIDQLQSKLQDIETRTTSLKAKEQELEDERTHAEEKLKLAQNEELAANDVVSQLSQQLSLLKSSHEAAKRRLEKAQDQKGDHLAEVDSLEEEQGTIESQIKQLRMSIRTSRQQVAEKQKSNADHERRVQSMSLEFESSMANANSAERECSLANERLDKTKEELRLLTVEENDLKAQINAINDALMLDGTHPNQQQQQQQRDGENNNNRSFSLSGRSAIGGGGSRRGSVVNIVDIPVNNNNNNRTRSGSAAVYSASNEAQQLNRTTNSSVPEIQIDAAAGGNSSTSQHPDDVATNASQQSKGSHHPNAVMSEAAQGFKMFSVSPEHAPVLVSMDTRHYKKNHFGQVVGGAGDNHQQQQNNNTNRSRSSVSPQSTNRGSSAIRSFPSGTSLQNQRGTATTPISTIQMMMQQQRNERKHAQHPLASAAGASGAVSNNLYQQYLDPTSGTARGLSSASSVSQPRERSTSRLSKHDADEVLFQQPGYTYHYGNQHQNQNQNYSSPQQQQQQSHPRSGSALQQLQQQQNFNNNNDTNSKAGNMSSVQSRLDSILQRKQQREKQQQML